MGNAQLGMARQKSATTAERRNVRAVNPSAGKSTGKVPLSCLLGPDASPQIARNGVDGWLRRRESV